MQGAREDGEVAYASTERIVVRSKCPAYGSWQESCCSTGPFLKRSQLVFIIIY